jgi:hypothetical protein
VTWARGKHAIGLRATGCSLPPPPRLLERVFPAVRRHARLRGEWSHQPAGRRLACGVSLDAQARGPRLQFRAFPSLVPLQVVGLPNAASRPLAMLSRSSATRGTPHPARFLSPVRPHPPPSLHDTHTHTLGSPFPPPGPRYRGTPRQERVPGRSSGTWCRWLCPRTVIVTVDGPGPDRSPHPDIVERDPGGFSTAVAATARSTGSRASARSRGIEPMRSLRRQDTHPRSRMSENEGLRSTFALGDAFDADLGLSVGRSGCRDPVDPGGR